MRKADAPYEATFKNNPLSVVMTRTVE